MAVGCTISVGNLYYIQPLLDHVSREFHVKAGDAGLAAMLSQVGYALGMLTIVPLGDMRERRGLILTCLSVTALCAAATAAATSFAWLCVASLALGLSTVTPQLLLPFAAHLARPHERGQVVGFVMSGLLIGILLARTVSGYVADAFGWRAVFWMAAILGVLLVAAMRLLLPKSPPTNRLSYRRLMGSLWPLFLDEPILRESAVYGACLFAAFSVFWTTLSFYLAQPPFSMGPKAVGNFGLVGISGALAAPIVGKLADRQSPRITILMGILLVLVSFAVFGALGGTVAGLVLGVILLDVGTQSSQLSNQSRIYSVRPESRSRMNTLYMTAYFVGGSLGSAAGSWAWQRAGWAGVCFVGAAFTLVGLGTFAATSRAKTRKVEGS